MTTTTPTDRGRRRRDRIVDAASTLFERHGFHATSMDDIGAAAGITGPGLYRHFESKDALLTAVFDRIWGRMQPVVERVEGRDPRSALEVLIAAHVDLAIDDPTDLALLIRELGHVPGSYRRAATRNHRRYVDAWVRPVRALQPWLDDGHARALVAAIHGAIDAAVLHPGALPVEAHRAFLRRIAADLAGLDDA